LSKAGSFDLDEPFPRVVDASPEVIIVRQASFIPLSQSLDVVARRLRKRHATE
jgi:hypothetical protein